MLDTKGVNEYVVIFVFQAKDGRRGGVASRGLGDEYKRQTSSTKAFLFDSNGKVLYSRKINHDLSRPKQFHVECDANVILNACSELFQDMVHASGDVAIHNVGLAVQHSTFLFWEKESCLPVTPAISWQDSRAHAIVDEFSEHSQKLWRITGTPLSAHFGGPKYLHMVRKNNELKSRVEKGDLYFGPLSGFLSQAMTGPPGVDESIACRSLFFDIRSGSWSYFALISSGFRPYCYRLFVFHILRFRRSFSSPSL